MPSDERAQRALELLAGDRDTFRSAVARTVDEVGGLLERQRSPESDGRTGRSLGPMATGRIDQDRFASLFAGENVLEPDAAEWVERAHETLSELHGAGDELFRLRVEEGGELAEAVGRACGRLGRAFGAARTADLARAGRYRPEEHAGYLESFPFEMWNSQEREIAPPLIVELLGPDLRPGGLSRYLDGGLKLVLLVEGPTPPAALVRLITPGVLVLQAEDPEALEVLGDHEGPGIAALFERGSDAAARFLHDPAAGDGLADRLSVGHLPAEADLRPVGTVTRHQQSEELAQLQAMAAASGPAAAGQNGGPPEAEETAVEEAEPADRLAGWLLRQSGLDELEG